MLARPTNGGVEQSSTNTVAANIVADSDPELQLDRAHVREAQVANYSILSGLGRDRHEALIVHVIECAERACQPSADAARVTEEARAQAVGRQPSVEGGQRLAVGWTDSADLDVHANSSRH